MECLTEEYFDVSRKFFEQPVEVKKKYSIGQDYEFGWVSLEGERVDPDSQAGDLHECFNYRPYSGYEAWPSVEKFETLSKKMFNVGTELAYRFLDVLSLRLGQPKDFMRNAHTLIGKSWSSCALRTLYYPAIKADSDIKPTQTRIGEHTDFGTVALTIQDNVGGVEVRDPAGKFVLTDPIPGTVLVYIGSLLQRWTADDITGASHRIPIPEDEYRKSSVRQSFNWFLHPDDNYLVTCLD